MNYWIIATIVICLFIWYIVKCWSKSFEIVNEGALAQEREAILEIIEQDVTGNSKNISFGKAYCKRRR